MLCGLHAHIGGKAGGIEMEQRKRRNSHAEGSASEVPSASAASSILPPCRRCQTSKQRRLLPEGFLWVVQSVENSLIHHMQRTSFANCSAHSCRARNHFVKTEFEAYLEGWNNVIDSAILCSWTAGVAFAKIQGS
jgi:hypothetical protein